MTKERGVPAAKRPTGGRASAASAAPTKASGRSDRGSHGGTDRAGSGRADRSESARTAPASDRGHDPYAPTKPAAEKPSRGGRGSGRGTAARSGSTGRASQARATAARPVHDDPYATPVAEPAPNRKRGGRRASGVGNSRLTSLPTGRAAYADTRQWLLNEHGPVCAYCGRSFPVGTMTLDHVAPRRGQTAYDRRDNLVLACRECNAAKRDLPPLAFLLQRRSRAVHLLRYGTHLSDGLVELARSLVPEGTSIRMTAAELGFHADEDEDDSPYA